MNKRILLIVFIAVAMIAGSVLGQTIDRPKKHALLKNTISDGKNETIMIPLTAKEAKALLGKEKPTLHKFNSATGVIDTLHYVEGRGTPYFGGDPGDTFAVYFKPGAGCKILKVGFNAGFQGGDATQPLCQGVNVSLNFVHYDGSSDAGAGGKWLLGEWTEAGQWVPTEWYGANFPSSPVSTAFWGPFPSSFVSDPEDQEEEVEMAWLGLEADNLGNDFAVVLVAYGDDGSVVGFNDSQTGITQIQRLWKYYITDRKWYLRHGVGFDVWCVVEFYENTPPTVTAGGPWGTTLDPGAKVLDCHISDIDADNEANAGVTAPDAKLYYKVNDGDFVAVEMTMVSGDKTDGHWEGTVPAGTLGAGDVLTYYFEATDGGGLTNTTGEGSYGFFAKTTELLVNYNDDGTSYPSWILSPYYDNLWVYADDPTVPVEYDVWVGTTDGAMSSALVDQYNFIVMIDAYSPAYLNDDVLGAWFAAGNKNMFWSSQEWAGQFLGGWGAENDTTFAADDWHNMYMGLEYVGGAGHDIATDPFAVVPVADDVISGGLATFMADSSLPLYIDTGYELGFDNWSDAITPNSNAVVCFTDSAQGRAMGIHTEHNGTKTVFLGFDQLCLDAGHDYWLEPNYSSVVANALVWFGLSTTTDVEVNDGNVITEYNLRQNYPNPFNPETKIAYSIGSASQVTLSVYNVLGQKIAELVNDHQAAGKYQVTWNANDLSSGVYFYRLEAGDYAKTMKMMLLR